MSPYENRLRSESFRRVGLITRVRPGSEAVIAAGIRAPDEETRTRWSSRGMGNVSIHIQETEQTTFLFLFMEFVGTDPAAAIDQVEQDPWFERLEGMTQAHPRADAGHRWMSMELINVIDPNHSEPADPNQLERSGWVVQLDPASELQYRTLHQTNWPGVVDQMTRSNRRCWITFLIELGDNLWLFTYSEYVGKDRDADDAKVAADPVTQRWWKHTQPCLRAATPQGAPWTEMSALFAQPADTAGAS